MSIDTAGIADAAIEAALVVLEETPRQDLDPRPTLAEAGRLGRAALRGGRCDLGMRARLLEADAVSRTGDVATGARIFQEVNRWAVEHRHPRLLALSHIRLSLFYSHLGDTVVALDHAIQAQQALAAMGAEASPMLRLRGTVQLANVHGDNGDHASARARYAEAERMSAGQIAAGRVDARVRITVLNNLAYTEYEVGDIDAAEAAADRLLAAAAFHGLDLDHSGVDTVARIRMNAGRHAEAIALLEPLVAVETDDAFSELNTTASLLLTLAETYRRCGDYPAAGAALDRCQTLVDQRGLRSVGIELLRERSEVLAASGRHVEAFEVHKRFHAAAMAAQSAERDARARTLHALHQLDEATGLREMALRDPLTGLYNRRYVDAELPLLLHRAAENGEPLAVAVVDLDHFKQINDQGSHEAGDRVLREMATLLTAAAGAGGSFTARLGGEEFLLVLPGAGAAEAAERMTLLCETVRRFDWRPITGDLPVTASIGIAVAPLGRAGSAELLHEADSRLYEAKRSGRDRVAA
ncbi:Response regulator pleD [Actinoplanes sp. SE50]|uniref:GGDEF domain-containing protein n=1 Tax=unclassified Actinoplanes TaxID=2626549 RepID=UPI00023EC629|nr:MULTISPECIES: GGDEF domain-containing protein [unclassified Actinoplanes]AEV84685.1 Response regulator pleD [Actinoplanes sp. SE50/110]ATO83077.1 Response regulator pleD [Actinoplanes sp. SE50]SLM00484.1 transcriptional regulator [Actinoplanes sp. SE50/110]